MISTLRSLCRFSTFSARNLFSSQVLGQYAPLNSSELVSFLDDSLKHKLIWQQITPQEQNDQIRSFISELSKSTSIPQSLSSCTGKQVTECHSQLQTAVKIMRHQFQHTKPQEAYPMNNSYRFHPFDFSTSLFDHRHPLLAACAYLVIACRTDTPLLLRPSPYVLPPILQLESIWNKHSKAKLIRCLVDSEVDPKSERSVIKGVLERTEGFISFWGRIKDGLDFHYYISRCNEVFRENEFMLTSSDSAYVMKDLSPDQLAKTAKILARACFSNCGHNFNSVKRVFVDQQISQQLSDLLCEEALKYSICPQLEKDPSNVQINDGLLAPFLLESEFQESQKLLEQLNLNQKEEFSCLQGGDAVSLNAGQRKLNFIRPAIYRINTDFPSFNYQNQECMLPICFLSKVDSSQSCIEKINSSIFGTTTTLFTSSTDLSAIQNFGSKVQVGTVNVNSWDVSQGVCYSGRKRSGKGFSLSTLSFNNLTRSKAVSYG